MVRTVALTVTLLVATAAPSIAQSHPGSHKRPYPHGPEHVRPDSATHAAIHAMLDGHWAGTLESPHGVSSNVYLLVSRDSVRGIALLLSTASKRAGAAREIMMVGDTLRWTQDLSGVACAASALVTSARATASRVLNGRLACDNVVSTFTLRKAE